MKTLFELPKGVSRPLILLAGWCASPFLWLVLPAPDVRQLGNSWWLLSIAVLVHEIWTLGREHRAATAEPSAIDALDLRRPPEPPIPSTPG
jgi:hypothetical protein